MSNTQNLIVPTSEVARKNGRKGGLQKAENERRRKTLKEELLILLEQKDYQEKISIALLEQAKKGNTKAYEIIRDTIGEKPKENINVSGEVNNPFAGMTTEELRKLANGH